VEVIQGSDSFVIRKENFDLLYRDTSTEEIRPVNYTFSPRDFPGRRNRRNPFRPNKNFEPRSGDKTGKKKGCNRDSYQDYSNVILSV